MYDLNEKKSIVEKLVEKLTINDVENEKNEQKVNEKLFVDDDFNVQSNIMKLIKTIYFDDVILQRFMKIKRLNKKRVFLNITKIEVKLKLVRCEIRDNFF